MKQKDGRSKKNSLPVGFFCFCLGLVLLSIGCIQYNENNGPLHFGFCNISNYKLENSKLIENGWVYNLIFNVALPEEYCYSGIAYPYDSVYYFQSRRFNR